MLTIEEIARSCEASWALFKGDMRGIRGYDASVGGFWRSFWVMLLLLPAFGISLSVGRALLLADSAYTAEIFPSGVFLWSNLLQYVVDWIDYPLLLFLLAGPLQLRRSYVTLIIALNWAALIAAVPIGIPDLLFLLGLIGEDIFFLFSFAALGLVLRYQYVITRAATGLEPIFAAGLVALDLCGSVVITLLFSNFFVL